MNLNEPKRHMERRLRGAPIFLAFSLATLLVSLWVGVPSLTYISGAVIIGLIISAFSLLAWKWRAERALYWTLFFLHIFILVRGETIVRRWAFPNVPIYDVGWAVLFQFLFVALAIQYGIMWAFHSLLKNRSQPGGFDSR